MLRLPPPSSLLSESNNKNNDLLILECTGNKFNLCLYLHFFLAAPFLFVTYCLIEELFCNKKQEILPWVENYT
ncbi:MAG TPA: hypothetical protein DD719_03720 [Desulfotomaculum sp.]|nr:hypothetical protein [Desulfotomaculum sp.]